MRGLLGQAYQSTNAMFHEIFGNPVFSAAKSRNIKALMQCSMKYLAIRFLVQLSQGIDLNF